MDEVIKLLIDAGFEVVKKVISDGPYMIVEDSAFVCVGGKKGRIVWDYLVYNELTFETDDGVKYQLYTGFSDKETKKRFDAFVSKYGI